MIKTKRLFILGAGASNPFDYPTGIELRTLICSRRNNTNIAEVLAPVNEAKGIYVEAVNKFISEFSKSSVYSIDSFLEYRTEFMNVGKMAIATYLIQYENDDRLRDINNNWYMYLFDRLKSSFDDFEKNTIAFITFNYDRSLEQFFFEALKSRFGKSNSECSQKLKSIHIVHLYGQLDLLPWQDNSGMPYSSKLLTPRIRNAQKNIKLINDERHIKESEEFKKAYDLMNWAEKIYFLGFSFDETNLRRLNTQLMKGKSIIGTSLGLEPSKRRWLKNFFRDTADREIELFDKDVSALLKENLDYE